MRNNKNVSKRARRNYLKYGVCVSEDRIVTPKATKVVQYLHAVNFVRIRSFVSNYNTGNKNLNNRRFRILLNQKVCIVERITYKR